MRLVSAQEMQEMDRITIEDYGVPGVVLMENAARTTVQIILERYPEICSSKVYIFCGGGNNGGDGLVVGRYLHNMGTSVYIYLVTPKSRLKGDALLNLKIVEKFDIEIVEIKDANHLKEVISSIKDGYIIDALLGTGLKNDVRGIYAEAIDLINSLASQVISIDLPSGLEASTGQILGRAIKANLTITYGLAKIGQFVFPGRELVGELHLVDICIPDYVKEKDGWCFVLTKEEIKTDLFNRGFNTHKGTYGHLLVIAGSRGKTGAAILASRAAQRVGAGLVTLGLPEGLNDVLEAELLEVMTEPLPEINGGMLSKNAFETIMELSRGKRAVAIGPGLGIASETKALIHELVENIELPLILDADAINVLQGHVDILKKRKAPTVLTPHPGEMARLIDKSSSFVQKDRVNIARAFAQETGCYLVLKGASSIIAYPDGRIFINITGNPWMATGGMGDILTGLIGGWIVQVPIEKVGDAVKLAVWTHGKAGDILAEEKPYVGLLASEVIDYISFAIEELHDIDMENSLLPLSTKFYG